MFNIKNCVFVYYLDLTNKFYPNNVDQYCIILYTKNLKIVYQIKYLE